MYSMKTNVAVLATAIFLTSVKSQAVYYVNPDSVPLSTRNSWCQSQTTTCPLLCLQLPGASSTTQENSCDAGTLQYECICGNGLSPNATEYSQTLPYFICTEYGNQCVANCGGATLCQSACRQEHPCGAQNPTRANVTSTSSVVSSTTLPAGASSNSAGVVYTGIGGAAATTPASAAASSTSTSTSKSGAEKTLDLGRSYGLAVVFAGLFAGFALVM